MKDVTLRGTRRLLPLLLSMLLTLSCGGPHRVTPKTLEVNINTLEQRPLQQARYGFNTNMMSGDYGYLDADFVELTQTLSPKTLRFPGGTVGNFYHWHLGGFRKAELASTLNPKLTQRLRGNFVKLQKRRKGHIGFDAFMTLCQRLNITPILVVNIWTGSPEESAAWVQYTLNKGYHVTHYELGNEFYLPHYRNRFPTVNAYLAEAKRHATAMKAVNPQIKLSVCATPIAFHKEGWLTKRYQRAWDEGLAADSDFYDAYSVHVYAYKAVQDKTHETFRGYLMGWIHTDVTAASAYYETLFGEKEMWITEWNIANPANRVANTHLHAMYVGAFFLKLLEMPKVTLATFHVLTGPGKGFPVFSRHTPPTPNTFWKYGGDPESDVGDTIRRAVFPVFQLIGEAVSKSETHFTVTLENLPLLDGALASHGTQVPGIQAHALGGTHALALLIANHTDTPHPLHLSLDGQPYTGHVTYQYVAADSLTATNGGNAAREGSGTLEVRLDAWQGAATELALPKNSFGILQIRRHSP